MSLNLHQAFFRCIGAIQHPSRLRKLLDPTLRRTLVADLKRIRPRAEWKQEAGHFMRRQYADYETYLDHQKSKLQLIKDSEWLREYDAGFSEALKQRLLAMQLVRPGMTVLCLAARVGTEVRAFRDLGCFAVGLDLNPGSENKYVVYGDFHDLQFASSSTDVVFTNSLDHALEPSRVLREVQRVLKPSGLLIVEASRGTEDDQSEPPEEWESFYWTRVDQLIEIIEQHSFRVLSRSQFSSPAAGDQICFQVL